MLPELLLALPALQAPALPPEFAGEWRATLASPGGELPFELVIDATGTARVVNGAETIPVPEVRATAGELVLGFPHYDSAIRAKLEGKTLVGAWEKRTSAPEPARLVFRAVRDRAPRFAVDPGRVEGAPASIAGRWSVRFASSAEPAVGLFEEANGAVTGTFLTTTGDYRFLAGDYSGGHLRLSCFDGAHAFLFDARATPDGLAGTVHSGASWTEAWTATRDDAAELADEWSSTRWDDSIPLAMLTFPDLEGRARSLAEWQLGAKAIMLVLLGSWCPNCHDELRDLAELDRRMRPKGLAIVGLAFEHSGEHARDAQQVRRALVRHRASFPVLLAGRSNKGRAGEAVPQLSGVRAFPTTVFLHRDGRARAVHTGYSGPGTGAAHAALLAEFERIATELIEEPEPDPAPIFARIAAGSWVDVPNYFRTTIFHDANGSRFLSDDPNWQVEPGAHGLHELRVAGVSAWFGDRLYAFDAMTGVFLDPFDAGHRLVPEMHVTPTTIPEHPLPEPSWTLMPESVDSLLQSTDARYRREALFTSVRAFHKGRRPEPVDPTPHLADADVLVRCVAAWATGELRVTEAVPRLAELSEHGYGPLRREVARALKRIGSKDALPALERLARDADPNVSAEARTALAELGR